MPLPDSVAELVSRFEANRKEYHQAHYNEAQTRIDFVNPLFLALGWDMDNRKALSEVQREVIHEDALKIGGSTKAPDYGFRTGGQRRFFLETKKPSVSLKLLAAPAYQLRRYAWTAKLPVSILTNFEEFAVYDGRVIPDHKDGPTVARLDYFKYTEMAERWDEIAARFSHDAVVSGAFERHAAEAPGRKSFIPVDAAFLARISEWRETLARNIVANNPGVTPRELNYAVQMIIDRIIFLRISEDRGVGTQYRLEPLQNDARVYPRLIELFRHADARYNSGLFHFDRETGRGEPDDITPRLTIDDRPLREIIASVYYPESPFEFSVFPADILGQVYEQFLGKVIRVSGKTAVVEDKPEVKKAGGVYYTPTYIVDYIVRHTVGKLAEGKTPAQVAKLTILDPACGSGSFLIGAYQFLLDWHLKYYTADDPTKRVKGKTAVLYLAAKDAAGNDVWRLTTAEKKRILLANIYGVDIDTQAVEVTKLSLLLKVLEGEAAELIDNTLKLLQERALPDLESNIQCGNSLIGPDFYADKNLENFDLDARLRINAFAWKTVFPKVMADGGFDAVIGNPPYIFGEYHDAATKRHIQASFNTARGQYDTYWLFIEQGLKLCRKHGYFSLIVPDALLARDESQTVREALLQQGLERIFHCGVVFQAAVSAVVFSVFNGTQPPSVTSDIHRATKVVTEHSCKRDRFFAEPRRRLLVHATEQEAALLTKMQSSRVILKSMAKLSRGEEIGKKGVSGLGVVPILIGDDITRYAIKRPSRYIEAAGKNAGLYASPKIVVVKTGVQCVASLDEENLVTMQSVYSLHMTDKETQIEAVLGLLNSRIIAFWIAETCTAYKLLFPQMNQSSIETIPLPPGFVRTQKELADKVRQMLKLHKEKAGARLGQEKAVLQQQIEATNTQMDLLVYDLYGLTEEEIRIVESAT